MPQKIRVWFNCVVHGRVEGHKCILCEAIKYARLVAEGKAPKEAMEGDGPEEDDPSPTQIALRAGCIPKKKDNEYQSDYEEIDTSEDGMFPRSPAEEVIAFIKESMPDKITIRFWEELQVCVDKQLGRVSSIKVMALTPEQQEKFFNEPMPSGKYVGRKVKEVYKKDKPHLIKMCYRPSLFQTRLRRLLWGMEGGNKIPEK